jgi:hypothetical protein
VYPATRIWLGQFDQAAFFSCIVSGHCPSSRFLKAKQAAKSAAQTYALALEGKALKRFLIKKISYLIFFRHCPDASGTDLGAKPP